MCDTDNVSCNGLEKYSSPFLHVRDKPTQFPFTLVCHTPANYINRHCACSVPSKIQGVLIIAMIGITGHTQILNISIHKKQEARKGIHGTCE